MHYLVDVHVGEPGDELRKDSETGFYGGTVISGNLKSGVYVVKFDDEVKESKINLITGSC